MQALPNYDTWKLAHPTSWEREPDLEEVFEVRGGDAKCFDVVSTHADRPDAERAMAAELAVMAAEVAAGTSDPYEVWIEVVDREVEP